MKTAAFIPVRLSSTRLPNKAFLKICGKPCIQYLIERIKKIESIDGIVLCTTKNSIDDKLIIFAKKMNIDAFRGSEVDILDRFKNAASKFHVKNIVNIDGDDILCEPEFIKKTVEELKKDKVDFISWKNAPLGTTPIGIKTSALETICEQKNIKNTETGWGKFFTDTKLCKVKYLTNNDPELTELEIRLTLDYTQDFLLFEQIIKNVKEPFKLKDIIKFLKNRKDVRELNKDVREDYWKNFKKKSVEIKMK